MSTDSGFTNDLSGALFKNDKGGNPGRPDYRGRCQIDGKEYRISAWIRTGKASGAKYMSLAFTLNTTTPEAAATAAPEAQAPEPVPEPEQEEIPF